MWEADIPPVQIWLTVFLEFKGYTDPCNVESRPFLWIGADIRRMRPTSNDLIEVFMIKTIYSVLDVIHYAWRGSGGGIGRRRGE